MSYRVFQTSVQTEYQHTSRCQQKHGQEIEDRDYTSLLNTFGTTYRYCIQTPSRGNALMNWKMFRAGVLYLWEDADGPGLFWPGDDFKGTWWKPAPTKQHHRAGLPVWCTVEGQGTAGWSWTKEDSEKRELFSIVKIFKYWNRFPSEAVQSPSLETFKDWLAEALRNLAWIQSWSSFEKEAGP